jgi:cell division protease FtsH
LHLRNALSNADCEAFADVTECATGADIQMVVRKARRRARKARRPLSRTDITEFLPAYSILPVVNLKANAIHEIGHAVVGLAMGMHLENVTVASRILKVQC